MFSCRDRISFNLLASMDQSALLTIRCLKLVNRSMEPREDNPSSNSSNNPSKTSTCRTLNTECLPLKATIIPTTNTTLVIMDNPPNDAFK